MSKSVAEYSLLCLFLNKLLAYIELWILVTLSCLPFTGLELLAAGYFRLHLSSSLGHSTRYIGSKILSTMILLLRFPFLSSPPDILYIRSLDIPESGRLL